MMDEHDAWLMQQAAQWRQEDAARASEPDAQGRQSQQIALARELERRDLVDRVNHAGSLIALAMSAVLVIVVAVYLFVWRGLIVVPALALLYVPKALILMRMTRVFWRRKREALASAPAQVVVMMRRHAEASAVELRWGQRYLPVGMAYAVALAWASLLSSPDPWRAVWALALLAVAFAVACYDLYVHEPRKLRARRARHDAIEASLFTVESSHTQP